MSQLQTDLKIIVGIYELEAKIKLLENLQKIESKVGLATQKDTIGEDRNGTARRIGIGFDGGKTAEDGEKVLDGTKGKIGQAINGIDNIYDCDSGKEIDIREDGRAIPPDQWGSAGQDPGASQWELGLSWSIPDAITWVDSTPYGAARQFQDWYNALNPSDPAYYDRAERVDDAPAPGQYMYNVWFTRASGDFNLPATNNACTPGSSLTCPTEYEVSPWPMGDKFQLIRGADGILRPHPLDPNVPTKYEDGVTTIDFCYGDGQTGRREATRDGGFMYYETDGEGGAATGLAKIFDANGVMVRNDVIPADLALYQVVDTVDDL